MTNEPNTVKPKKRGRPRKPKVSQVLKMVISRTYSEGAKVNIGNYQSRDFFASATRMMEIPLPCTQEEQESVSAALLVTVKQEVKEALKAETDDASGTKPMQAQGSSEEAPSVPDAFSKEHERVTPWKKFVPREDNDDLDDVL